MSEILKISVALTSEQFNSIQEAVEEGKYATTSEVIRDAVRLWENSRDVRFHPADIKRLRHMWDEGKASGPAKPLDWNKLRKEARKRLTVATKRKGRK